MNHPFVLPKKLIEVALPLDAINVAAAREKSIRHGHPSTLHLWWARRPLAAARAVIFSQLVNDPEDLWRCQNPGVEPNKQTRGHWTKARARLFKIIEDLVLWENTTNEEVLGKAREEIRRSWREVCELNKEHPQAAELFNSEKMPGLHDPFAGGGTIPLEAQRLGLEAHASDLNPVAVLINKAMIEIPPKFADMPPINPESRKKYPLGTKQWHGAEGLAEDVRYYGKWMRDEAERRIGHLYPKVEITEGMTKDRPDLEAYVGQKLTVIAWLWARTVRSPNPAFSNIEVPLAANFVLASKPGKEAYVEPVLSTSGYRFEVRSGQPTSEIARGTSAGTRKAFRCLMSGSPISYDYIRDEGQKGRVGQKLMAIVAVGKSCRVYLSPTEIHEQIALKCNSTWKPEQQLPNNTRDFKTPNYGLNLFADLFTQRQLVALTTFADLVGEARDMASADAMANPETISCKSSHKEYSDAIAIYLGLGASKSADYNCSICSWMPGIKYEVVAHAFTKQALPMTWDYAESNVFAHSSGDFFEQVMRSVSVIDKSLSTNVHALAFQSDAQEILCNNRMFISTDPPYYDNIGYADLSDFFYIWLRRSLRSVLPDLFATILVPKKEELVATPYRHGTKERAEEFFLRGMTEVMHKLSSFAHPASPITIYYAFKQSDTKQGGTNSTGWQTFLAAVLSSGLYVTGTWPMRTERSARSISQGTNSLASSIILVCRPRSKSSSTISRREFIRELNAVLPIALDAMTRESEDLPSPVAPVDLSQAIIGPGMAIFSKYSAVLEADGTPMTVRTALQLINRFLAEDDFDADTQFCLHWFDSHGWEQGVFGEADVLARAKATSVNGLVEAGVLRSGGGKVQLLRPVDFSADWNPEKDTRVPIWEILHQLIRSLRSGGESVAGKLLSQPSVASRAEAARQLAYRLYTLCERKGWAEDARAYNEVVTSWSGIESASAAEPGFTQRTLFDN
jgi:putative DNA methylase